MATRVARTKQTIIIEPKNGIFTSIPTAVVGMRRSVFSLPPVCISFLVFVSNSLSLDQTCYSTREIQTDLRKRSRTEGVVEMAVATLALERVATLVAPSSSSATTATAHPRRRLGCSSKSRHHSRSHTTHHRGNRSSTAHAITRPAWRAAAAVAVAVSASIYDPTVGMREPAILSVALHAELAGNRSASSHHDC